MEVSSQDPSLMAMDLSKGYSVKPITRGHTEAMDLVKKPEWYHRRPASCSTERSRSRAATSYSSLPTRPEAGASVHCRDMDQGPDTYMNSTLAPGLEVYRDTGVHGNLWHPGFYGPDQSGGPGPESSGGEESDSDSDVIFLVSSAKEPLLCSPFIQEGVRHIVEPLSPAVSSLDEGRGCYHLPQPMSSPSPDSSYSDDSSDSSVDIPVHHTRPIVLLSDLSSVYGNPAESPVDISSDDSDVIEVSVSEKKKKRKEPPSQNKNEKTPRRGVRHSSRIRKSMCEKPRFTCGISRHNLRRQVKYDAVGIYNESCDSDDMLEYLGRLSSSDAESVAQPKLSQRLSSNSDDSNTDRCKKSPSKSPLRQEQPQGKSSYTKRINYKRKNAPTVGTTKKLKSKEEDNCRVTTRQQQQQQQQQQHQQQEQQQQQQQQQQQTVSESRKLAAKKKTVTKRKRKKCGMKQSGPSSLFPFTEPEIKFKYVKIKEEKKEKKSNLFCPFVHMERRMCTVVNYQEEEATMRSNSRRGLNQTAYRSTSGFVPTTSCFHLGRLSPDSGGLAELLCCLCGQTANAVGLGDLHGPYRPAAGLTLDHQQDDSRTPLKEDPHGLCNSHSDDKCSAGNSLLESDNHSLPKVPLNLDESWIHEDCGIWSAGVFLVRGKLYGLGEAARLAQQTICSTCQQTGAIMGCFQKGCPRNYHYRCAIQSGCVLNEDNFSMRCPDHKNKLYVTRQHKR